MPAKDNKSKSTIPKNLQLPLLLAGLPLLIFSGYRFATQMGWIGGPPKAKTAEVAEKAPDPAPSSAEDPGPVVPRPRVQDDLPELASIRLGPRDPLADLILGPPDKPASDPPPGDTSAPGGTTTPGPPPPLPQPVLGPIPGTFPSPVPGELLPGLAPVSARQPVDPSLPPALTTAYPRVHRGSRRASKAAAIALVGTISGSKGSLAVVRSTDVAGGRGTYVRPGEDIGRSGQRVEEIEAGRITVGGSHGTHELTIPDSGGHTSLSGSAGSRGSVDPARQVLELPSGTGSIEVSSPPPADAEVDVIE